MAVERLRMRIFSPLEVRRRSLYSPVIAAPVLPPEPDRIALANLAAEASPAPIPGPAPQAEANDAQPAVVEAQQTEVFSIRCLVSVSLFLSICFRRLFCLFALFGPGVFLVAATSLFQFSFSRFVVVSY